MVLLNVVMLAIGGAIGLSFLARSLKRLAMHAASDEFDAMIAAERSDASRAENVGQPADGMPSTLEAWRSLREGSQREAGGFGDPAVEAQGADGGAPGQTATARSQSRVFDVRRDSFIRERTSSSGLIFWIWVVLYGAVGAQTGWLLRPFIGHPSGSFEIFRPRSGNFFMGVLENLSRLLGL